MTVTGRAFNARLKKATADRISAYAEFCANSGIGTACLVLQNYVIHIKGLIGLERRWMWSCAFRIMQATMFSLRHQLQVFYRVVQRITIDMMHDLPSFKGPTEMFRHHNTVLVGEPSVVPKHAVAPRGMYMPTFPADMFRACLTKPIFRRILCSWHDHIITCRVATLQGA